MDKQKTRNLTIDAKTLLFKKQFPNLQISRSTVWKIQRKYLNYSYKRITKYRPKKPGNSFLKKIAFIQKYLQYLENDDYMMFIIDEAGFGIIFLTLLRILFRIKIIKTLFLFRNWRTCTSDQEIDFRPQFNLYSNYVL